MTSIRSRGLAWLGLAAALSLIAAILATHDARAETKATPWTGVHVGASLGHAQTVTAVGADVAGLGTLATLDGIGTSGLSVGLSVGADLRIQQFLLGAFVDWTRHDQEWSLAVPALVPGPLATWTIEDAWTIGGRAGVIVGDTLIYGLLGYTTLSTSDIAVPPVPLTLAVSDMKGWTLGGGLEMHLGQGIFLAAEYRYTRFDDQVIPIGGTPLSLALDPEMHEAKARLSYKFGLDLK